MCATKLICLSQGVIQVLRNADGGGWVSDFLEKIKRYEGVMVNVISVTMGWMGGGGGSNIQKNSVT